MIRGKHPATKLRGHVRHGSPITPLDQGASRRAPKVFNTEVTRSLEADGWAATCGGRWIDPKTNRSYSRFEADAVNTKRKDSR